MPARPWVSRCLAVDWTVLVLIAGAIVIAAGVLTCLPGCTGPAARRVARSFTVYAGAYDGTLENGVSGKRAYDTSGTSVGVSLNLGAWIPPDPQPVYVADPGAAGRPVPGSTPATPHHFVRGADGCWRCEVPGCGKTPDEVAEQEASG